MATMITISNRVLEMDENVSTSCIASLSYIIAPTCIKSIGNFALTQENPNPYIVLWEGLDPMNWFIIPHHLLRLTTHAQEVQTSFN